MSLMFHTSDILTQCLDEHGDSYLGYPATVTDSYKDRQLGGSLTGMPLLWFRHLAPTS